LVVTPWDVPAFDAKATADFTDAQWASAKTEQLQQLCSLTASQKLLKKGHLEFSRRGNRVAYVVRNESIPGASASPSEVGQAVKVSPSSWS
jgi:hypothetical protein